MVEYDRSSIDSTHNRRQFIKAVSASSVALTTGVAGCLGGGGGSSEITIGALYPLSGNLAQLGEESARGTRLAVKQRNENDGVSGNEINLVEKDAPDADAGVSTVENLVNQESVDVIVGSYSSTISRASTQRADSFDMPYWELGAIADKITGDNPGNVFRTNPQASSFGASGVNTARDIVAPALDKDPKDLNIAVMYESGEYGNSVANTVKSKSEEENMNIVLDIEYDAGTSDLSSSIQNIKNEDVDVVNHTGYSSDIYLLWNQSADLNNYVPAAIGNGAGYSLQAFVKNIGTKGSMGVLNEDFTQYNTNPQYAPGIEDFVSAYRSEHDEPPLSGHSLANYFGANVLLDVLSNLDDPADFELSEMKDAASNYTKEIGSSPPSWGVKFDEDTFQNTRTTVTGHQWQKDTYTEDIWHPDRDDGTADLYTLWPEEGRMDFAEPKNIPRPHYEEE